MKGLLIFTCCLIIFHHHTHEHNSPGLWTKAVFDVTSFIRRCCIAISVHRGPSQRARALTCGYLLPDRRSVEVRQPPPRGAILRQLGTIVAHLGYSWRDLCTTLAYLGISWRYFGQSWPPQIGFPLIFDAKHDPNGAPGTKKIGPHSQG